MSHHNPPPPLPPLDHQTSTHVLKQSISIFNSHLLVFLFLSALVFTFRSNVENGSHYVISFIDRDPSMKSLLSRIDISGRSLHSQQQPHIRHHHRRRPFLHLSRVGTLDDDFFSGDDDYDRSLFRSSPKHQPNGTFLRLGFTNRISDNGIRVSEVVHSGISFRIPDPLHFPLDDNPKEMAETNAKQARKDKETEGESEEGTADFQFFLKGLELGHRDATSLLFLVGILSAAYGYVIIAFLVTYCWVLGIVFVTVVTDFLGKYRSFLGTVWDGSNLGLRRLSGFILMRWAVRDALTQLLGVWFFGEIEDQYTFFKVFVRLKLMPFAISAPWAKGYERESTGFLLLWFLMDAVVAFIFAVDSWVVIVDSRKSGREVVKEGCHLLSTMLNPAINIRCLEGIICGSLPRLILSKVFGKLFALAFQSLMEVYFMVAWLIFYLAANYKDFASHGTTFGRREMESFLEDLR